MRDSLWLPVAGPIHPDHAMLPEEMYIGLKPAEVQAKGLHCCW